MTILLTKNLSRQWSRIGPRGIYGQSLLELSKEEKKIYAISADLGNSSGLDRYKQTFPERFLNIGIAEQNLVGFASGLSTVGFNVFISSFAPFITMRACEQVRLNLGYMKSNVKIVAIGSGLSMGFLGNSHFGLEDISIIRSIPNIPIICPCDCFEVYKALEALSRYEGPAFLRLTGAPPTSIIYQEDYEFKIGKSISIKEGNQVLILSHGTILGNALQAVKKVEEEKSYSFHVENVHTLTPLDKKVVDLIKNFSLIITIEEHSLIGGLSSIVSEIITDGNLKNTRHLKLGLPPKFLNSGTYEQLLEEYDLSTDKIYKTIIKELKIYFERK
tara:strand:+ start:126 stop:1118 length:993 start_codon:yes stop_codon:yes gene_type:complete